MKELKYIKLFEAFESEKLSKTLGYIDSKSRKELLNGVKRICDDIDYPYSLLNDSLFQYLPYHKALDLQYVGKEIPCQYSSKKAFGSSGVEGEVCQSGKLKRIWGTRQRVVDCPNCDGTGIQPERQELKIIKFWFTKEGEIVAITGVDNVTKPKEIGNMSFSRNLSDYNIVGSRINRRESLDSLLHGDMVYAQLNNGDEPLVAYVYRSGRSTYLLQDNHDGDSPSNSEWKEIAENSWNITGLTEFIFIEKLKLKKDKVVGDDIKKEIDPFSFNKMITFGYSGFQIDNRSNKSSVEKLVKKAHFALVLNLEDLKSSKYKSKRDIKDDRIELKSGSRLVLKDEDVKKANIERYMKEIAKRSDIVSDISNLPKVIKRLLGGENVLFLILYNSRFINNSIFTLAEYYFGAIQEGSSSNYYKERLSIFISDKYKSVTETSLNISNNIKAMKKYCEDNKLSDEYKIIDGLQKMSKKLYDKITNVEFDSIEDIDIAKAKLESIRGILRHSRYSLDNCDYLIGSLENNNSEQPIRYLTDHYYITDNKEKILSGIEQGLKFLDRF
jgi:hypothetical protein